MRIFLALLVVFGLISSSIGAKNEICNLPPAANGDGVRACLAYMPSYSYNPSSNECVSFIYGGCGGNANRFNSVEECENTCKN